MKSVSYKVHLCTLLRVSIWKYVIYRGIFPYTVTFVSYEGMSPLKVYSYTLSRVSLWRHVSYEGAFLYTVTCVSMKVYLFWRYIYVHCYVCLYEGMSLIKYSSVNCYVCLYEGNVSYEGIFMNTVTCVSMKVCLWWRYISVHCYVCLYEGMSLIKYSSVNCYVCLYEGNVSYEGIFMNTVTCVFMKVCLLWRYISVHCYVCLYEGMSLVKVYFCTLLSVSLWRHVSGEGIFLYTVECVSMKVCLLWRYISVHCYVCLYEVMSLMKAHFCTLLRVSLNMDKHCQ